MPTLLQLTRHRGRWECDTCVEEYRSANTKPWQTENKDSLICPKCIAGRFEQALENDYSWPARFGPSELQVTDYEAVLDEALVEAVKAKEAEIAARVDAGIAPEALEGQVRGTDYQICPGCRKLIALKDGCNHITCHCLQNFCFICGKKAKGDSAHWLPGGCPRYGLAGAENALFDTGVAPEEEPEEEEEEEDQGWLFDSTSGLDEETFDELLNITSEFTIGPYAWAVAMQASRRDAELRATMQRTLQAERWAPSREDRDVIERALRAYGTTHRISRDWWAQVLDVHEEGLQTFLTRGPARGDGSPNANVRHGVLAQPVNRVFNMSTMSGRSAAFAWMYATVHDWSDSWIGRERSYAVFDMGPSGNRDVDDLYLNRVAVARLILALGEVGDVVSKGRFTFTDMRGTFVHVTVNPPQEIANPLWEHEAYWRRQLLENFWTEIVFQGDHDQQRHEENQPFMSMHGAMMNSTSHAWVQQTGLPSFIREDRMPHQFAEL